MDEISFGISYDYMNCSDLKFLTDGFEDEGTSLAQSCFSYV